MTCIAVEMRINWS